MFTESSVDETVATFGRTGSGPANGNLQGFLVELLSEQQLLQTPVSRASATYDRARLAPAAVAPRTFRDLIPLTAPLPGEQYAFEVDLDSCSGCKACVAGCHSLNGLDEEETWRDIGVLIGKDAAHPFQQTVTTACHHCEDPGCLNGCPVLAYEKDPVTGIVRHLDDQCIGCQYCVLKCPYDVPKYNERLGIVRKCDMCHQRLAIGEAPACVQACPTEAIRIVKVETGTLVSNGKPSALSSRHPAADEATKRAGGNTPTFLPASPDWKWTRPTTRYVTRRPRPARLVAGDFARLHPQHAHVPLVLMLVFTQASVGALLASLSTAVGTGLFAANYLEPLSGAAIAGLGDFVAAWLPEAGGPAGVLGWLAVALAAVGLTASVAHLGQPFRAWRVFLNLRRSWLSREAVVFGGYFGLAGLAALAQVPRLADLPQVPLLAGLAVFENVLELTSAAAPFLAAAAFGAGLVGVICSIMIYADTPRAFWRLPNSGGRMLGTMLVGALALVHPAGAAVALAAKLTLEAAGLRGPTMSARLQRGPLRALTTARFVLGAAAIALFLLFPGWPSFCVWLLGELAERRIFFRAVDSSKMPGMPA